MNSPCLTDRSAIRSGRFVFLAALAVCVISTLAAQTARVAEDVSGDVIQLETFSVTGTNIKRANEEKIIPVLKIDVDAMNARDAITPIELLTAIPQVMNTPLGESVNASF